MQTGDTVLLLRAVDSEWVYGRNTRTNIQGIAPLAYLKCKFVVDGRREMVHGDGMRLVSTDSVRLRRSGCVPSRLCVNKDCYQ